MQLPEFARSTTLWWTLLVVGIFAAFIVALLGFVYLKTRSDLTIRSDRMIASQMDLFAHLSPERRLDALDEHLKQDPGRVGRAHALQTIVKIGLQLGVRAAGSAS